MLKDEVLPYISGFYQKYEIKGQYTHWLKASFKLTKSRIFFGGITGSMPIGKVEISIKIASFMEQKFKEEVPEFLSKMSGFGIFTCFSVYPTHSVKPFKICFKCSKRTLDPGKGHFFSRTDNYQLCQNCGFIEIAKRDNPILCPPYKMYLYFKLPSADEYFSDKLQILSQEDYNPSVREKKHPETCVICNSSDFTGIRFKCAVCKPLSNLEICERCAAKLIKGAADPTEENNETLAALKTKTGCPGLQLHTFLTIYFNNCL